MPPIPYPESSDDGENNLSSSPSDDNVDEFPEFPSTVGKPGGTDFVQFTPSELKVMKRYIPEFRNGNSTTRAALLTKICLEVYPLQPSSQTDLQWAQRGRDIKRFFLVHGRKRIAKYFLRLHPRWTKLKVLQELRRAEIAKYVASKCGKIPGSRAFLAAYQPLAKEYIASLPKSEHRAAEKKAEEWERDGPPLDIQQKIAEKHGGAMKNDFAEQLYRLTGERVLMFSFRPDAQGGMVWTLYDENDRFGLGAKRFHEMYPSDLDRFLPILKKWGQATINGEGEGPERGVRRHGPKQRLALKRNPNGLPLLPLMPLDHNERLTEIRAIFRSFVTMHYQLACGVRTRRVPWNTIAAAPEKFIADQFFPPSVKKFNDPTRIGLAELALYLQHWRRRQSKSGASDSFRFSHYYNHADNALADAIYDPISSQSSSSDTESGTDIEAPPLVHLSTRRRHTPPTPRGREQDGPRRALADHSSPRLHAPPSHARFTDSAGAQSSTRQSNQAGASVTAALTVQRPHATPLGPRQPLPLPARHRPLRHSVSPARPRSSRGVSPDDGANLVPSVSTIVGKKRSRDADTAFPAEVAGPRKRHKRVISARSAIPGPLVIRTSASRKVSGTLRRTARRPKPKRDPNNVASGYGARRA